MSKRFTETLKWSDPWFQDLPAVYKCAWCYILDNCDNAGAWILNTKLMSFQVGEIFTWEGLKAAMGDRLIEFAPGKLWVPKFIEFQYGRLSPASKPHLKVLSLLRGHGLEKLYAERFGGFCAGYRSTPSQCITGRAGKNLSSASSRNAKEHPQS